MQVKGGQRVQRSGQRDAGGPHHDVPRLDVDAGIDVVEVEEYLLELTYESERKDVKLSFLRGAKAGWHAEDVSPRACGGREHTFGSEVHVMNPKLSFSDFTTPSSLQRRGAERSGTREKGLALH